MLYLVPVIANQHSTEAIIASCLVPRRYTLWFPTAYLDAKQRCGAGSAVILAPQLPEYLVFVPRVVSSHWPLVAFHVSHSIVASLLEAALRTSQRKRSMHRVSKVY